MKLIIKIIFWLTSSIIIFGQSTDIKNAKVNGIYKLPNVLPALNYDDDLKYYTNASRYIPVKDEAFIEQIRESLTNEENENLVKEFAVKQKELSKNDFTKKITTEITALLKHNGEVWIGTGKGLYIYDENKKELSQQVDYGVNGPLSTSITDIEVDSKGTIWIGTPIGLSYFTSDNKWNSIQGKDGLPIENITAVEIDKDDKIWLGTNHGAILFTPYEDGRKWYYRAGKRYLINNEISDIIISAKGMPVYFETKDGISKLSGIQRSLSQKAEIIEELINIRHRRLGLVASCILNDSENPTSYKIKYGENDGLWTSYHVTAMSLAYAATGNKKYLESAKKSMHAIIMLQNASGVPGLIARSVVPINDEYTENDEWRKTSDGKFLWKSDASSDEMDGHFFAFYSYWEHIAKYDKAENKLIKKQISEIINYLLDNDLQLIDWDGKRTYWGFWNPEMLNDDPDHYLENGLNSAQILSFLKVAYYITGNEKYKNHFDELIVKHNYLANVLLEKKVFPDENNHSDNQLAFCALYPWLQLEHDPIVRNALQQTVRRHYKTLSRDGSAFFYFAAASIDPDFVDIKSAVKNLIEIPTDRRQWLTINSIRKDIQWSPYKTRFNKSQLISVLPPDEMNWDKWNDDPYVPDGGGNGTLEDDGASWLLAYWMGRYYGFIGE